ncbi:MAG: helix-hairpin-helix domain-containing protein [Paludibacteraceae bacterium]|nr:helix-hairpin-helix domain-containing protein [Paludibacteraceae bacterium]
MALKDYFFFTKEERRGVAVLLVIICILIGVRVVIAASQAPSNSSHSSHSSNSSISSTPGYRRYIKHDAGKIELNTADSIQLQELKGIGPGFARRIVIYREKLGGYYAIEQLMEVYGFTEKLYNLIKNDISVDASKIRKININQMDISRLKRHPYISYYEAKAIYEYRIKQPDAKVKNLDEMANIPDLEENWQVIRIYITAE